MTMTRQEELLMLLRKGRIEEVNKRLAAGESVQIRGADLVGANLQGLHADGLDMRDCHLRHSDLRGIDFSNTRLEGSSIIGAKISGALFPRQFSAQEITLSLLHGTRLRADRT